MVCRLSKNDKPSESLNTCHPIGKPMDSKNFKKATGFLGRSL